MSSSDTSPCGATMPAHVRALPRRSQQCSLPTHLSTIRLALLFWATISRVDNSAAARTTQPGMRSPDSSLRRSELPLGSVYPRRLLISARARATNGALLALRGGGATGNASVSGSRAGIYPVVWKAAAFCSSAALGAAEALWEVAIWPLGAFVRMVQWAVGGGRDAHVTRATFSKTMDEIEALLPTALHVALDVEMTSLEVPWDPSSTQVTLDNFQTSVVATRLYRVRTSPPISAIHVGDASTAGYQHSAFRQATFSVTSSSHRITLF
jgi:hypothetical protein